MRPPGRFGLDWMMITVGLIAGLLVAGAVIRTETFAPDTRFGSFAGGLLSLAPNDTLVAFETYEFGTAGWDSIPYTSAEAGLGGVVGPLPVGETVSRTFVWPEGTVRAVIIFDLVAIDDWGTETLEISLGDTTIAELRPTTRPGVAEDLQTISLWNAGQFSVFVAPIGPAQDRGFGAEAPGDTELVKRVRIALEEPGAEAILTIQASNGASGAATEGTAPHWAIDNLTVVAERLP